MKMLDDENFIKLVTHILGDEREMIKQELP